MAKNGKGEEVVKDILIPKALHKKLKEKAAKEGKTIREITITILEASLD